MFERFENGKLFDYHTYILAALTGEDSNTQNILLKLMQMFNNSIKKKVQELFHESFTLMDAFAQRFIFSAPQGSLLQPILIDVFINGFLFEKEYTISLMIPLTTHGIETLILSSSK